MDVVLSEKLTSVIETLAEREGEVEIKERKVQQLEESLKQSLQEASTLEEKEKTIRRREEVCRSAENTLKE